MSNRRMGGRAPRAGGAARGFSFIEVLVVMGIIAVLVGLAVGILQIAGKRTKESSCDALLGKVRSNIDLWKNVFKTNPPTDLNRIAVVTGLPIKVGKPTQSNTTNIGIEALYQCLMMPGFSHNPDLDGDLVNTDNDMLDKALAKSGAKDLFEIKDPWGNPLVYMVEADYAQFDKEPPAYVNGQEETVYPKPYKAKAGGFEQANGYQLFSMGPDGQPNTDDDRTAWQRTQD